MDNTFVRKVNDIFDLPPDAEGLELRLVLCGNHSLRLENHQGLLAYDPDKVVVACNLGAVVIYGENMGLTVFNKEEIFIEGAVVSISFTGEAVK